MEELDKNKKMADKQIGSGKELYELQRKQKEEANKKERRKQTLSETPKKVGRYLIYILIGAGLIGSGWLLIRATGPKGQD